MRPLCAALVALLFYGSMPVATANQTSKNAAAQSSSWPGWGGPRQNFTSDAKGLANTWPPEGPKRIWSRALGEGHSSIIGEGGETGRLYTMYRPSTGVRNSWKPEEVVVALDAASGKTIWEYRYPTTLETMNFSRGAG